MYALIPLSVIMAFANEKEQREFEAYCATLPEDEMNELLAKRKAEKKAAKELHEKRQHELDITEAGKTKITINNYHGYW